MGSSLQTRNKDDKHCISRELSQKLRSARRDFASIPILEAIRIYRYFFYKGHTTFPFPIRPPFRLYSATSATVKCEDPGSMRIDAGRLSCHPDVPLPPAAPSRRHTCYGSNLLDEADSVADTYPLRPEVSSCMMCRRVLSISLFAWAFAGSLAAQIVAFQNQSTSSQPSSEPYTIAMTVPNGTPLQIALDKEVRVRKGGRAYHWSSHAARLRFRSSCHFP
jgi:hypothetical protein